MKEPNKVTDEPFEEENHRANSRYRSSLGAKALCRAALYCCAYGGWKSYESNMANECYG